MEMFWWVWNMVMKKNGSEWAPVSSQVWCENFGTPYLVHFELYKAKVMFCVCFFGVCVWMWLKSDAAAFVNNIPLSKCVQWLRVSVDANDKRRWRSCNSSNSRKLGWMWRIMVNYDYFSLFCARGAWKRVARIHHGDKCQMARAQKGNCYLVQHNSRIRSGCIIVKRLLQLPTSQWRRSKCHAK